MALWRFSHLQSFPQVVHAISERALGSVYPEEAGGRRRLAEALGVSPQAIVPTRQVHGRDIERVPDAAGRGCGDRGVDGLVTDRPGICLLTYFADCVPLLAYDPRRRAVGVAHAGWCGTVLRVGEALVQEMTAAFGTHPDDLIVGIGPAIGPCCYEVGDEVAAAVRGELPAGEEVLRPGRPGHAYLDLWEANRQTLLRAGVPPERIEMAGLCTACHVDRFFSYRREGRLNGQCGAVIGLVDVERGQHGATM